MTAVAIISTLQEISGNTDHVMRMARDGFLEWLISLPETQSPQEAAIVVINSLPMMDHSRASRVFCDYLEQTAASQYYHPTRRGGSKSRRRLH